MRYLELTVGAIFVYNFVLSRFLGICPFLGVSKRTDTALGMSGAVICVMTLSSCLTSAISHTLLEFRLASGEVINLKFLQTLVFILVIAGLVQLIEIVLQKISPALYSALGIYLPLITTNCAVLGSATICAKENLSVLQSTVFGFCSAVGFALALVLFSGLRERLTFSNIPEAMKGTPIALISAGILAMAFMGFTGLC